MKKQKPKTAQKCEKNHLSFQLHCKSCKNLQSEWYAYAAKAGFEDIEKKGQEVFRDKKSTAQFTSLRDASSPDTYFSRLNYFLWASDMANHASFKNNRDKRIWEAHADGRSLREIAPQVKLEFSYVSRKITQIKSYLQNQTLITIGSMSQSLGY